VASAKSTHGVNAVKRVWKQLLGTLGLLVIVGAGVIAWLSIQSRYPDAMNMGAMGMDHAGHQMPAMAGPTTSCTDLKDPVTTAPVRAFDLTAETAQVKLDGGKSITAWTFNGSTPGPELRVQEGDRVVVHLTNKDIAAGVTIHWHGVVLPCSQDGVAGVTQDAVKPGDSFTYEFIARNPGTYWYHSHQASSEQTQRGLLGRLIVEPKVGRAAADRDYAVTLQKLDDQVFMVNGEQHGLHLDAKPGETVRLRLVNSENNVHLMALPGVPFQVISMDGHDINSPTPITNQLLPVGGGQRYDLLFQMPATGTVQVVSADPDEAARQGLRIAVGQGDPVVGGILDYPHFDFTTYGAPVDDGVTINSAFDRSYDQKLSSNLGFIDGRFTMIFKINGHANPEIPPLMVKEGDLVKIRFQNQGDNSHPMHLHGHVFKVLTKNGKALTGSPIYLDTLLVGPYESYEVAFRADNPGLWMEHCHNLSHAARGMTMMVDYLGVTTPFTVGRSSGNLPDN
jgi:FtsP/CotA-like multicopper oxidase with cupredoxin domain